MTEPDLDAIELRWEAADLATIDSRKTPDPDTGIMGVGTTNLTAIWDSARDVPDLLELVKAVKLGWEQERNRADNLQAQADLMLPVIQAAQDMIDFRNQQHGNPSNPAWWSGGDFRLVAAMDVLKKEREKSIVLDGEGAERAAEILVRRGKAEMMHASPNCACGVNEAGEQYTDPICVGLPTLKDMWIAKSRPCYDPQCNDSTWDHPCPVPPPGVSDE